VDIKDAASPLVIITGLHACRPSLKPSVRATGYELSIESTFDTSNGAIQGCIVELFTGDEVNCYDVDSILRRCLLIRTHTSPSSFRNQLLLLSTFFLPTCPFTILQMHAKLPFTVSHPHPYINRTEESGTLDCVIDNGSRTYGTVRRSMGSHCTVQSLRRAPMTTTHSTPSIR
jgi:hypothetical protein